MTRTPGIIAAPHVERQVGEDDLGLCAADADGADEQAHVRLLVGEDVLNAGAHLRFNEKPGEKRVAESSACAGIG
jgi:hypothetical protein